MVQETEGDDKSRTLTFCSILLLLFKVDDRFTERLIMSDGNLSMSTHRRNPEQFFQWPLHINYFIVYCGISWTGVFAPYFFQVPMAQPKSCYNHDLFRSSILL